MLTKNRTSFLLALTSIAAACVIIFVWIPLDSGTGYIEKVRRQVNIGDALAPTLAASFVLLGGLLLLFDRSQSDARLTRNNVSFLILFLAVLGVAFAVMRWAGPISANFLTETGYRPLRDTMPWKYVGFFLGGTGMIAALIGLVEGRVTLRAILIGVAAAIALIAVFDLPFDDLLLPPNGDV